MDLRSTTSTKKDGSVVECFHFAHNERHPGTRKPIAKIIHTFGRVAQLDRRNLVRLRQSIGRVCGLRTNDPLDTNPLSTDLKLRQTVALSCSLVIETLFWESLGWEKGPAVAANASCSVKKVANVACIGR